MGIEFLLLGLIAEGVRGFYSGKGKSGGGKFIGGTMTPKQQEDFKNARNAAAGGDAEAKKQMQDMAKEANAERLAAEGAKGAVKPASSAALSKLEDKNLVSLNKGEKDQIRKLNNNSSEAELEEAIRNMGIVDVATFDTYIQTHAKMKGNPPTWNEYFRQLSKIMDTKDPDEVKAKVKQTIDRSIQAGKIIGKPDPAVAKAAAKKQPSIKGDPQQFYREQGRFYREEAPKIIQQFGDIRLAQLKRESASTSSSSTSKTSAKGNDNFDNFDLDSLF